MLIAYLGECAKVIGVAIKAAVKAQGLDISTYTREPGMPITAEEYQQVQHILQQVMSTYNA